MLDDVEDSISAIAFTRRPAHQSCPFNARNGADPFDQSLEKADLLDGFLVTRFGQRDADREHIVDRHADVVAPQALIALQQQTGAYQKNDRKANFEHQEGSAKHGSYAASALRSGRLLQRSQN